ncbi:Polynucleotide 5'-hydroxyl-kinase grc3 [Kluyveromyces marxianus]|nr:Polynucleotide 5'-hydroxyl-kinase grc3 [Kluyveromyces marxianus]
MSEDILQYSSNTDSDDSDFESAQPRNVVIQSKESSIVATYDEDDGNDVQNTDGKSTEGNIITNPSKWYSPIPNENMFFLSHESTEVLVGLTKNQQLLLCGQFNLQIVKGGITYNNVHYNSSWRTWEIWHPVCNAVSPIISSFYAGWESKLFLGEKYKHLESSLEKFNCVLRISNGSNIALLTNSVPDLRDIWGPISSFPLPGFHKKQLTFTVVPESSTIVRILNISLEWSKVIDEMCLFHSNSSQDMRVMVIGGKNSGKSTLMRLLLQKFLHSDNELSDELVHYIDIDPGQTEYSAPESISWNKLDAKTMALGQHLCQGNYTTVKQHFLGSSSPQDLPTTYSNAVESLLKSWEDENFMGTSFLNIPGWIKGFGVKIINHALSHFKPTHIIFLSHNGKPFSSEIMIPEAFSTTQRTSYKPIILELHSPPLDKHISPALQRFNAAKIRQFKITAFLHRRHDRSYNVSPLLLQTPLVVPIGNGGIAGIKFLQSNGPIHEEDINLSLDGTLVALHSMEGVPEVKQIGSYPIMNRLPTTGLKFVTLALIHSINIDDSSIRIYVPDFAINCVKRSEPTNWIILRGKTETPIHELLPTKNFLSESQEIPYISLYRKKRNEHVWKVRKNVMRRGHHMK